MASRWKPVRTYPVEGDSAEFELWLDGEQFAAMWLEGIDLSAHGATRTAQARVVVQFFERASGAESHGHRPFTAEYDEATRLLAEGRAWLLENERGRVPL
jgi:hypothetical protein